MLAVVRLSRPDKVSFVALLVRRLRLVLLRVAIRHKAVRIAAGPQTFKVVPNRRRHRPLAKRLAPAVRRNAGGRPGLNRAPKYKL